MKILVSSASDYFHFQAIVLALIGFQVHTFAFLVNHPIVATQQWKSCETSRTNNEFSAINVLFLHIFLATIPLLKDYLRPSKSKIATTCLIWNVEQMFVFISVFFLGKYVLLNLNFSCI